ncbi:MAG: glycosyltransferase family 4 protein [Candidatus Nanoarchaeia archaeon]|nr:glycosyltransferase family 4 protein [Candidatus Nanoarchaeia archaeon]
MKITLISWYFPSMSGGAEKSITEELKKYSQKNNCKVISFDERFRKGKFNIEGLEGINIPLKYNIKQSRFISLKLNKNFFIKEINKYLEDCDLILTQSLLAPIVSKIAKNKNIPYHYYLRDENNLNEFHNYENGFKYILKIIKDIIDFPFRKYYAKSNLFALENATKIIANSKFIQKSLLKKYGLKSIVKYPPIDYSKLNKKLMSKNPKYITFIGGGKPIKGYDVVLKIAKELSDEKFIILGRYKKQSTKNNVIFMPLKKNIMEVYSKTKLLLVPSRWKEAFGRVVLEAQYVGIPVITSNQGGLPEANKNKNLIIEDLENIDLWVNKIKGLK